MIIADYLKRSHFSKNLLKSLKMFHKSFLLSFLKSAIVVKTHSKVPTFGQEFPHLFLSLPDLVSAIYDSGITFFSSACMYSRSL